MKPNVSVSATVDHRLVNLTFTSVCSVPSGFPSRTLFEVYRPLHYNPDTAFFNPLECLMAPKAPNSLRSSLPAKALWNRRRSCGMLDRHLLSSCWQKLYGFQGEATSAPLQVSYIGEVHPMIRKEPHVEFHNP